ncbi:zinc transporter permease subunit ZevB [Avibacterium sp. 20-15]|uniref:zinc transporter permease subunit ZevB n=1 Tax=unclassified Avibacterium TaxID=2685287 RepID=UPI002025C490|nr:MULTISPECIES: zinc transporter permease subunit ZevB [unclassified Avibacterium]MCW9733664.1 zinc transporter permease subunit ZevB [Avibacterium sp. 20-15]URL01210.1 zinc transporter permease subunit ZevB [Avibacterium sp. 20-126]URL03518.1 zinc transporter permease subunit ZevB [Avibacterium sp. 20-132]
MQLKKHTKRGIKYLAILLLLVVLGFYVLPYLFGQTMSWQKAFNQSISGYLHQINHYPVQAGLSLMLISFLYGVLHALGPGHGKFVIASYLSTHQSQLKTSVQLTLLSSLMQGLVAVVATSILVAGLQLSSHYFKLSQLWLERSAFILMFLLGIYWIYQSAVKFLHKFRQSKRTASLGKIHSIKPTSAKNRLENPIQVAQIHCDHEKGCCCGHQHLPSSQQLDHATNFKSRLLVILTIGMRPCSGAIFILFLSYMLNLYKWGIAAAMAMAVGTGMTLSLFALIVQYARQTAVKLGRWYFSSENSPYAEIVVKLIAGGVVIFFATALFYGTTLPMRGGAVLFGG